ncbi:MAG: hypothetical protein RLY86_964 [Pseudomonadota bacterium]|jgi:ketosteroid isomerase-like protein
MTVTDAASLFAVERAVREQAACGLWHGAAIHTIRVTTPHGELYGRDDLIALATARCRGPGGVHYADPWLCGAGPHAVWSARLTTRTGDRIGLEAGLARLTAGRVAELWCFAAEAPQPEPEPTLRDPSPTGRPADDPDAFPGPAGSPRLRPALLTPPPPLGFDPALGQLPPDPAAELPPTLPAPIRAVLARWLALFAGSRFDLADGLYAPDAVLESPIAAGGSVTGIPAITRTWLALADSLPDLRLTVLEVVAPGADTEAGGSTDDSPADDSPADDGSPATIALLWHLTGTRRSADGRPHRLALPVLSLFRITGNRITAERLHLAV